jgi:hypothetical protein
MSAEPTREELLARIAALEARVSALEADLRAIQDYADQCEAARRMANP